MKSTEKKAEASNPSRGSTEPFFAKGRDSHAFSEKQEREAPFFHATPPKVQSSAKELTNRQEELEPEVDTQVIQTKPIFDSERDKRIPESRKTVQRRPQERQEEISGDEISFQRLRRTISSFQKIAQKQNRLILTHLLGVSAWSEDILEKKVSTQTIDNVVNTMNYLEIPIMDKIDQNLKAKMAKFSKGVRKKKPSSGPREVSKKGSLFGPLESKEQMACEKFLTDRGKEAFRTLIRRVRKEAFFDDLLRTTDIFFIPDLTEKDNAQGMTRPVSLDDGKQQLVAYELHLRFDAINSGPIEVIEKTLVHELSHIAFFKLSEKSTYTFGEVKTGFSTPVARALLYHEDVKKFWEGPPDQKGKKNKAYNSILNIISDELGLHAVEEVFAYAQALTHIDSESEEKKYLGKLTSHAQKMASVGHMLTKPYDLLEALLKVIDAFYEWRIQQGVENPYHYRRKKRLAISIIKQAFQEGKGSKGKN